MVFFMSSWIHAKNPVAGVVAPLVAPVPDVVAVGSAVVEAVVCVDVVGAAATAF